MRRWFGRAFVGGASFDFANAIAVDSFGNTYVTGETFSNSFLNAPLGGAQAMNKGGGDSFVAKLNFNGSALLYLRSSAALAQTSPAEIRTR